MRNSEDCKAHDLLVIFRLFIALAKNKYLERLKCSAASRAKYSRKLTLVWYICSRTFKSAKINLLEYLLLLLLDLYT